MDNFSRWVAWLPIVLFVVAWLFSLFCLIWGVFDVFRLIKPEGKIKRGFKIRTKPLSLDAKQYLMSISEDIIDRQKSFFGENISGFIRVRNNEVIICSRDAKSGSSFPHIGYINLNLPEPVIEIRSSLPTHLFLIPFVLTIILIPFVLLVAGLSHYGESASFDEFLNRKVEEYKQQKL
jgi:hypothetical protein